jgi:hypothetical protein
MCRPQRIGVLGQRGVGKTTLLTMLYREAVGGRLPDLRLAVADARTAEYLSDKVLQLEAGRPLPATLAETELCFHLYYHDSRLDLVVKDYQGEHVALGRQEPIRQFLLDCDAVLVCLDVSLASDAAGRLRAQQEVEQVVEDYLTAAQPDGLHRPMALLLTKADLLPQILDGVASQAGAPPRLAAGSPFQMPPAPVADSAAAPIGVGELVERRFAMTQHALRLHCPQHAMFPVSSLGGPMNSDGAATPFTLRPVGLEAPLAWLARALQAQDEARLARLWVEAGGDLDVRGRCVACFRRRYPAATAGPDYAARLQELRRRRRRRRWLAGVVTAACLVLGVGTYDAVGEQAVERFAAQHAEDPRAVREAFLTHQVWHPTRHLLRPAAARAERERLGALDAQVRRHDCAYSLEALRRRATDADADAEAVWQQFQAFRREFPEQDVNDELRQFRSALKARRDAERERRARDAFAELERLERQGDLSLLAERADRFLRDFAGTSREAEVSRRRAAYLLRLDERDIDDARGYSAGYPLNYHTRREHYQRYLERHPEGAYAGEAREALAAIEVDWDRYDFRRVRDHFQAQPGDVKELEKLARSYLAVHPAGRFAAAARDLLRWTERVTEPAEYRVVLRSGSFDKSVAAWFSRGPSLSVELEVGGVRYGPSNIVARSYGPAWDYEFPRRIRWKLGDSVRIVVTDHYYWDRTVAQIISEDGNPLAMRLLTGEVQSGRNSLTFESDFRMPEMPKIE